MCEIGSWKSFHSRTINGRLCAIQQCTECGDHRALEIENCQFVSNDEKRRDNRKRGSGNMDIPEPDSGDEDGSFWGPN